MDDNYRKTIDPFGEEIWDDDEIVEIYQDWHHFIPTGLIFTNGSTGLHSGYGTSGSSGTSYIRQRTGEGNNLNFYRMRSSCKEKKDKLNKNSLDKKYYGRLHKNKYGKNR